MSKGIARAGWDIDLADGEIEEGTFSAIIRREKIEHKAQLDCRTHLYVELEKITGEKSGLSITTSVYWAFEYDKECWIILPTVRLWPLVMEAKRLFGICLGGDYNNTKGVSIPLTWFVDKVRLNGCNR